jgi:hypothetical protein
MQTTRHVYWVSYHFVSRQKVRIWLRSASKQTGERACVGVCPSNPSLRGKGDAGRCEAAGSKNRRRIRWNTLRIFRAENDSDACRSFAAVEWHDSDRFLGNGLPVAHSPIDITVYAIPAMDRSSPCDARTGEAQRFSIVPGARARDLRLA